MMTSLSIPIDALVIIPTYNEKENITLLIEAIRYNCPVVDILVVDDSSPDGTGQAVAQLQTKHPNKVHLLSRPQKLGLGTAYITGFQFALTRPYQYVLTMDADFSHPPSEITTLYTVCKDQGYDVAIGSRYIKGVQIVNWPLSRIVLSYSANLITRLITGAPIRDLTAGFQCYRKRVLETIDVSTLKSIGYSFQVETKFLAWKYNFKIKEIPIVFTNRVRGYSKMSHRIIFEAFARIITLKVSSLFRKLPRKNLTY